MKKFKKLLAQTLVFSTITLTSCQAFATDILSSIKEIEFSESYLQYLDLEDKENVIIPRMYEIPKSNITITNPLRLTRMVGSSSNSNFSLKTVIPANVTVKNQQQTNSCWTFAGLSALETNLALKDYKNGVTTPTVYDFSERHMEYATSKTFKNNVINPNGFNREVGDGGSFLISIPYLTNGTGAILESEMPFENSEEPIYISEIQNKEAKTQVNDMITFPSYSKSDDKTQIIKQMKEHIKNYGSVDACIHGATLDLQSKVYNNETGALYCDNSVIYPLNHGVSIIGWDDNYSVDNFVATNKPQRNGAWIIKNSWGTEAIRVNLAQMKEMLYESYPNLWTSADAITDEDAIFNFTQMGFKIDANNEAYMPVGDNGFMYISYEDANIYTQLSGIVDAQNEKTYENIYQYDEYGAGLAVTMTNPNAFLATEFDRKSSGVEYLTQVSLMASETYTCKVYVNPNGTSKAKTDLIPVQLKSGETETIDSGYHTLEFAEPLKINSDKFVVVIEIKGTRSALLSLMIESNLKEYNGQTSIYDNVKVSNSKCFLITGNEIDDSQWIDTSKMKVASAGKIPNFDTTIKAFTTAKILENIQVTTPPTKTNYVVGQDFDKSGMVVKGNYANGESIEITNYTIQNGTNLALNQNEITIVYNDKITTQPIVVEENTIESIEIKNPATKTEYWAGEDFDSTGMVIEAIYKDGKRETITDYTIQDGQTLKNGQTTVTISYEGKTTKHTITVIPNPVEKIEITQAPSKVNYISGQNFDTTGMVVTATYENGANKDVVDYIVQDGKDLKVGQTTVTISYEDKTATQEISVIEKAITGISIKTMPTKVEYIQNKEELNLEGGVIEASYNDETKEDVLMTSEDVTVTGFNNEELGTQTLTVTYKNLTTQFDIEIKELPKPQNSEFSNMKGNVTKVRAYSYTDKNKKEHTILNVELDNIVKATENEKMEYYYYLSVNPNEENISDWVKIKQLKEVDGKMHFEINTLELANYEELAAAKTIHLYVKEVATRNDMKSEKISESLPLEVENIKVEQYVDGNKKEEVSSGTTTDSTPAQKEDDTKAPGSIPKAGHDLLMICLAAAIIIIGKIAYSKYKDIEIK